MVGEQDSSETYVLCMDCLYAVDHIPNRGMIYDARHTILEERSLHFGSHSVDSAFSYVRLTCLLGALATCSIDYNLCHPTQTLEFYYDVGVMSSTCCNIALADTTKIQSFWPTCKRVIILSWNVLNAHKVKRRSFGSG